MCSEKIRKIHSKTHMSGLFFMHVEISILLKKRLQHMCFPLNFAKFLRFSVLENASRQLFLIYEIIKSNNVFTITDQTDYFSSLSLKHLYIILFNKTIFYHLVYYTIKQKTKLNL